MRSAFVLPLVMLCGTAVVAQGTPTPTPEAVFASAEETPIPAIAPIAPAAPARRSDRTYTFQLVLLLADNTTPSVIENVPAKAQKALEDLRDFLPYKSYHLVDMAWLRTSRAASSQVTGPKGETYIVELSMAPASGPGERLIVQDFRINQVAMMPPPGASLGSSPTPRAIGQLLSSTFGMELGETVVVGTAKIDGPGKALIVLLTALP